MSKIILKEDFIIPKGTEFTEKICTTTYYEGNYETTIGTSKDSCAYFIINDDVISDRSDLFEIINL